jgi:hypothetical protein
MADRIRLAVSVSEFGAAVNVGGGIETTVRTFDLPDEVADYIRSKRGQWSTVSLAIDVTPAPETNVVEPLGPRHPCHKCKRTFLTLEVWGDHIQTCDGTR